YLRIEAALTALGDVVVPSHAMADFLAAHGLSRRRLHVIPNGVAAVGGSEPRSRPGFTVGTAANLEYWKGIDVLVDACRLAGPLRLEVFGDGAERARLERQARDAGVDARFHGFVADLPARLGSLDAFALPSRAE